MMQAKICYMAMAKIVKRAENCLMAKIKAKSPRRKLKAAREAAGISQEALAADVGLSASQISRFESGERDPRDTELALIAHRLGVRVVDLFDSGRAEDIAVKSTQKRDIISIDKEVLQAAIGEMIARLSEHPQELAERAASLILSAVTILPEDTAEKRTPDIVRTEIAVIARTLLLLRQRPN